MREIKFRAWHIEYKRIVEIVRLAFYFSGYGVSDYHEVCALNGSFPYTVNIGDIILMQYTGLKDKTGQEIFEGDIVQSDTGRGEVNWMYSGWYSKCGEDTDENIFLWASNNQLDNKLEIIGNIHENPELLSKEGR